MVGVRQQLSRGGECLFGITPILTVRNLTKRYASLLAVDAVSFSISPGDVLGYLGPNGSGKSTTVKMLTGLLEPTHGEILFHGRPVRDDLIAYKQAIGYVPEEAQLYGFLTGWEYLELIATLRNIPTGSPRIEGTCVRCGKPAQVRPWFAKAY